MVVSRAMAWAKGELLWMIFIFHPFARVLTSLDGDALYSFKVNLDDPNSVLQSWNPLLVNPCTWAYVSCNSELKVTRVDLGNAALSGSLVPQLGLLKNLQYLELYNNNITGKIPDEFGNLSSLVIMDLYLNHLSGPIPETLGKLSKLRFLRLNNNSLTGSIPKSLTNIDGLQVLDLSSNHLSGEVPSNGSFSLFTPLSFNNNPLLCGVAILKHCPWSPPFSPPPPPLSESSQGSLIVGVVPGLVAFIIVVLGILFVLRKRSRRTMKPQPPTTGVSSTCTFTYKELKKATNGFSADNILGEGGFGYVYKGILPNGTEVAVKLLKPGSWQGESEFQTEVETISRVHHRNLISLVGYSNKGNKKILVYAFVPNKTLEFHLHGSGQPVMEWSTRMKIALDSAKGLAYLHEDCYPTIVHRDVKASNILLDFNFEPKISDFGLAKFLCDNITHVTTRVVGTFGYLAPEYAATGKLTDKSDVFSYGVILLELITGRRPVDQTSPLVKDGIVEWAMPLLSQALDNGKCDDLVDDGLQKNYDPFEMSRMIGCAAACLSRFAQSRPRMSQVVRLLEGEMSLEDHNYGFPGNTDHLKEQNRVEGNNFSNEASVDSEKTRWNTSSNFTLGTGESDRNTTASSSEIRSVGG